ncbi:MAG: hypothetical protein J4478_04255 [Candidatus Diapherotrites archaeon]|uniref:DUF2207 domain-containing protein n=1 Tax=Candidatus Iainarchaeum sp. TaxID=3101447 RepID=A0A7J4KW12_9ARCH|nr:hypothetical protein [Candidatus Diapherotrites archaeon]HIH21197.1 hypothetical protein [Candidatus Diapherotrites archaeon]HIH32655.1 hypothetical protein [Candidatus Diapherotrites archaeon]
MAEQKNQASIIELIQQMVSEGVPEEKIVQTLKELGVEPEKAKRLLLLGQADTFALLRSEIARIVVDDIEKEKPNLVKFISEEGEKAGQKSREKITTLVMQDVQKYEKAITGQSKSFQELIGDNVRKVTELSDRVKDALNELGEQVGQLKIDMDEMKIRGIGLRNRLIGLLLLLVGIAFLALDFYLFVTKFIPANAVISPDSLIVTLILALVGVTLVFLASAF